MEQSCAAQRWAEQEFGDGRLGDTRRTRRLVGMAAGLAGNVGIAISSSCGRSGAQAVSRLLCRGETTLKSVTSAHIEQTAQRCSGTERILAVQDTTALDFSTHGCTEGLGYITTSLKRRGLLMHTVLAVKRDKTPLGLLGVQIWSRDDASRGCSKSRRGRMTSQKESRKWLQGLAQAQSATADDQPVLVVGDRESDVYALFVAPRRANVGLLVRAAHNRRIADGEFGCMRDAVENGPVVGSYWLDVPRQGSRRKRTAQLEVRVARVDLRPPINRASDVSKKAVRVSLIRVVEIEVPDGVVGLEWTLLTSDVIETLDDAVEMIHCYGARWVIEEFHKVLKSGCRVEDLQLDTAERLIPAIGIMAVVAWRVLYLTKRARQDPEMNPLEVGSAEEVKVMSFWLKSKGDKQWQISTASQFNIAVARLGGFLGRKSDGMPGTKTTWQGLRQLEALVLGYRLATQHEM